MRECNNSKIHISSNFLLSICLIIMLDTLLTFVTAYQITRSHKPEEHNEKMKKQGYLLAHLK